MALNDFGALELIYKEYTHLVPVWGRLFSKYFGVEEFMYSFGVTRMEFDSVDLVDRCSCRNKSFYYPYRYVTNTRFCPVAGLDRKEELLRGIIPCNKECIGKEYWVINQDVLPRLLLKGNTLFLKESLKEREMNGVDRLIFEPSVPL